jgi:hypothetical protein
MFRYNTYFGINTVHYMDLIETSESQDLPMRKIILSQCSKRPIESSNGERARSNQNTYDGYDFSNIRKR